jgi:SAM-dependent methyltransferase
MPNPPAESRSEFPPEPRNCPICNAPPGPALYRQSFAGLSGQKLLDAYDIVVCRQCGFAYAGNIPGQAAFDRYYRDLSKYGYQHRDGLEPPWVLKRFTDTAEILRPFIPSKQSRILDIGCANGGLIGALKKIGFTNVLGFDPSPDSAAAARKLHDVLVETRSLADLPGETRRFDLIILGGVLEHVRDLRQAIADIRRLMTDSAILYVEVPDATRFADHRNAPYQEFSLEHINFFSETSLANLMGVFGLTQRHVIHEPRHLSADTFEPCILAVFSVKPASVSAAAPRGLSIRIDTESGPALTRYIEQSNRVDRRVCEIIDDLVASQRPIIVWGVGTHTLRLLAMSGLSRAKIAAFVDSNPNYAGKTLAGVPVILPGALRDRPEPILISSWVYQREIERQIRRDLPNEPICLYEMPGPT